MYAAGGAASQGPERWCQYSRIDIGVADVDAHFAPARAVRTAAARVAAKHDVPEGWLNDAVKGFLSADSDYRPYLMLANLSVLTATPEYLL